MTLEWQEILFSIWNENHKKPHWADVYELHDLEDREYFMDLEV